MTRQRQAPDWMRLAWGAALLAVPHSVIAAALEEGADVDRATAVVRVLGVRHITQAVIGLLLDDSRLGPLSRRAGAALDLLHVASLPFLARLAGPAQRRLVALDAPVELLITARQVRSSRST